MTRTAPPSPGERLDQVSLCLSSPSPSLLQGALPPLQLTRVTRNQGSWPRGPLPRGGLREGQRGSAGRGRVGDSALWLGPLWGGPSAPPAPGGGRPVPSLGLADGGARV